jgi:ferredoxin-type protein NapF
MATETINQSRRSFLRRSFAKARGGLPLPWTQPERFAELCNGCGDCIAACPEGIIQQGDAGLPGIDFAKAGCTFCGACAKVCPEQLFDLTRDPVWDLRITISQDCLAEKQVVCQSCRDACDQSAIAFPPVIGRVAAPLIDDSRCTACGSCVSSCPVAAISLEEAERSAA